MASEGVTLFPGLLESEIRKMLQDLPLQAPSELVSLYGLCNGMAEGEMDHAWFELWPLQRVVANLQRQPVLPYLAFAEGFMRAHEFWLRVGEPHQAAVFIGANGEDRKSPRLVAQSLDEAFSLLLRSPEKLALP